MIQNRNRRSTRVVAISEFIFAIYGLIINAGPIFFAWVFLTSPPTAVSDGINTRHWAVISISVLAILLFGAAIILRFISAVQLLKASSNGATPAKALSRAKFWRVSRIVITIFDCVVIAAGAALSTHLCTSLQAALSRGSPKTSNVPCMLHIAAAIVTILVMLIVNGVFVVIVGRHIRDLKNAKKDVGTDPGHQSFL